MTFVTAYLTFSAHRARQLESGLSREQLAEHASGIHADRAAAVAYAAREASPGRPFILFTPAGELELVPATARDAQLDATIAREERDYAECLRRTELHAVAFSKLGTSPADMTELCDAKGGA